MRVKPAKDRQVRFPSPPHQLLPEDGREVPDNQYWRRRIRDRDVEVISTQQTPTRQPGEPAEPTTPPQPAPLPQPREPGYPPAPPEPGEEDGPARQVPRPQPDQVAAEA